MPSKDSKSDVTNHPEVRTLEISPNHDGQRLDNYLVKILKGVPKTRIYRLIRKGEVRVNRKRIKPDYRIQAGDLLRIPPVRVAHREQAHVSEALKALILHSVLYQDEDLLILNKPAGIPVHGGTGVKVGLIEALRESLKEPALELVHRLDKETSGCLVIARHNKAVKALGELFKKGEIDKRYHALVEGEWPEEIKMVDAPLQRQAARGGERKVKISEQGKSAKTLFSLLGRFRDASLVEAHLLTGRTHQIRVHCQQAGYPLIADNKYAAKSSLDKYRKAGLKHLCLHARSISFRHPFSEQIVAVEAPLSEIFNKSLTRLNALAGHEKVDPPVRTAEG